jgi:CheY-like chemotaxis protein
MSNLTETRTPQAWLGSEGGGKALAAATERRSVLMREIIEKNRRVLLVEDAPFLRYAFGRLLRTHGYDVMEAGDGQEALECVSYFQPDLVITDLMMPVMDGVELIEALRNNPDTADLPVLAVTADGSARFQERARAAGAQAVLAKPIDFPSFLEHIRSIES